MPLCSGKAVEVVEAYGGRLSAVGAAETFDEGLWRVVEACSGSCPGYCASLQRGLENCGGLMRVVDA